jgi:hypothetical protein
MLLTAWTRRRRVMCQWSWWCPWRRRGEGESGREGGRRGLPRRNGGRGQGRAKIHCHCHCQRITMNYGTVIRVQCTCVQSAMQGGEPVHIRCRHRYRYRRNFDIVIYVYRSFVFRYRPPPISKFLAFDIVVSAISGFTISKVKTAISMVNIGIRYCSFLVTYDIVGRSCQYRYLRILQSDLRYRRFGKVPDVFLCSIYQILLKCGIQCAQCAQCAHCTLCNKCAQMYFGVH